MAKWEIAVLFFMAFFVVVLIVVVPLFWFTSTILYPISAAYLDDIPICGEKGPSYNYGTGNLATVTLIHADVSDGRLCNLIDARADQKLLTKNGCSAEWIDESKELGYVHLTRQMGCKDGLLASPRKVHLNLLVQKNSIYEIPTILSQNKNIVFEDGDLEMVANFLNAKVNQENSRVGISWGSFLYAYGRLNSRDYCQELVLPYEIKKACTRAGP